MLRLRQKIYWIGGSACAGKSTLAKWYAQKHGLTLYACDEHFTEHMERISPQEQPAMDRVSRLTANEAFYTRGIEEQLNTYIECFREDFALVLRDLTGMKGPVVVEGNQLLPSLVAPLLEVDGRLALEESLKRLEQYFGC